MDFHSSWLLRQSNLYDRQLWRFIYKEKPADNLLSDLQLVRAY